MDRTPGGGPSDGAFERFLTSAIATILTIIFSWRLLLENEHETPAIEAPPPPALPTPDDLDIDDESQGRSRSPPRGSPSHGQRPLEVSDQRGREEGRPAGAEPVPGSRGEISISTPATWAADTRQEYYQQQHMDYNKPDFGEYSFLDTDHTDGGMPGVGLLGYDTIHPYAGEVYGRPGEEEEEDASSDASSGNTVRQRTGSLTEGGSPSRSMGDLRSEEVIMQRRWRPDDADGAGSSDDDDDGVTEREYMLGEPLDSSSESEYCVVFRTALEAIAEEDTDDMGSVASSRVSNYSKTRMDDLASHQGEGDDSSDGITEPISEPDGGLLTSDADWPSDSGSIDVQYDKHTSQLGDRDPRYGPIMGTQRPLIIGPYHDRHLNFAKDRGIIIPGTSTLSQPSKDSRDSNDSVRGNTPEYDDYQGSYQSSRIDDDDNSINEEPAQKYRKADDNLREPQQHVTFMHERDESSAPSKEYIELKLDLQYAEGGDFQKLERSPDNVRKPSHEVFAMGDAHPVAMESSSRAGSDAGLPASQQTGSNVTQAVAGTVTFTQSRNANAQQRVTAPHENANQIGATFDSKRDEPISVINDNRKSALSGTWTGAKSNSNEVASPDIGINQVTSPSHSDSAIHGNSHRSLVRQEGHVGDRAGRTYIQYIASDSNDSLNSSVNYIVQNSGVASSSVNKAPKPDYNFARAQEQHAPVGASHSGISAGVDAVECVETGGGPPNKSGLRSRDQSPGSEEVKHILVSTSRTFIDAPLSTSQEGSPTGFTFVRTTGLERDYKHRDTAVYRSDLEKPDNHVDNVEYSLSSSSPPYSSVKTPTIPGRSEVTTGPGIGMRNSRPEARAVNAINIELSGGKTYSPNRGPAPSQGSAMHSDQFPRRGYDLMGQKRELHAHGRPPVHPQAHRDRFTDSEPGIQRNVGPFAPNSGHSMDRHVRDPMSQGSFDDLPYSRRDEPARPGSYMPPHASYADDPGFNYGGKGGPSVPTRRPSPAYYEQGLSRNVPQSRQNVPYFQRDYPGDYSGPSREHRQDYVPRQRSNFDQGLPERRHDPALRKSWDGSKYTVPNDHSQFRMPQTTSHHRSMEFKAEAKDSHPPPPIRQMHPYLDPALRRPVVRYDENGDKRTCTALATSTALARKELDIFGGDYTPDEVQKSIVSAVASAEATGENPYVAVARATARAATIASANASAGATRTVERGKDVDGPNKDISVVISTSCTIKNEDSDKTMQDARDVVGALSKGSSSTMPQMSITDSPKTITRKLQSRDVHEVEKTRKMTITIEQAEKEANKKEYRTVECEIPQGAQNNDLIATISEAVRGILASQPNVNNGTPQSGRMLNEAIDRVTRQVVRAYSGDQEPPGLGKEGGNIADILSAIPPPNTPPKPGFEEIPNPFKDGETYTPYTKDKQTQPTRQNVSPYPSQHVGIKEGLHQGHVAPIPQRPGPSRVTRPLERTDSDRSDRSDKDKTVFYVTGSPLMRPYGQGNVDEVVLKVVTDENLQPSIEHVQLSESESEMDTPVQRRKFGGTDPQQQEKPAVKSPLARVEQSSTIKHMPDTYDKNKEAKQQTVTSTTPILPSSAADRPFVTSGPPAKPTKPKPPRPKLAPQIKEKYKNSAMDEVTKGPSSKSITPNNETEINKRSSISSLDSQESSKTEATTASTDSSFAVEAKPKPPKGILKSRSPLPESTPESEKTKPPFQRLTSEEYDEEIENLLKKFEHKISKPPISPTVESKPEIHEKKPYESVLLKKPRENVKTPPHVLQKIEEPAKETPEARRKVNTARKDFMVKDKKTPEPVRLPAPYEDLFEARRKRWNEKPASKAPKPSASIVVVDIDINGKESDAKAKSRSIEDIKRQLGTIRHKPPPPPPVAMEWKTLPERLTKSQEKLNISDRSRCNSLSRSEAESISGTIRRTKSMGSVFPGQFFSDKMSYTSLLETDLDTGLHTETPLVRETDIDTLLPPKSKSLTNLDTAPGWTTYSILDEEDRRKSMEAIPTQPMSLPAGNGNGLNGALNKGPPERALSAHELRITQSLSKLSVPDWYRTNPRNPKEIIDLPNVRNRSPQRSPYTSHVDVANESFASDTSQSKPVVIMHRVSNPIKMRSPGHSAPTTPIDGARPDFQLPSAKLRQKNTTDYRPIETKKANDVMPPGTVGKRFPAKESYLKLKAENPSWTTNSLPVSLQSSRRSSGVDMKSVTLPADRHVDFRPRGSQTLPANYHSSMSQHSVQPEAMKDDPDNSSSHRFVTMQFIQIGNEPKSESETSAPLHTSTPNHSGPGSVNDQASSSGRSSATDAGENQQRGHYQINTTTEQLYESQTFKATRDSYVTTYSLGKTCSDLVDSIHMNEAGIHLDDSGVDTRSEPMTRMMQNIDTTRREIRERADLIKAEESLRYEYLRDTGRDLDTMTTADNKGETAKNAFPILSYAAQPNVQKHKNEFVAETEPELATLHVTLANTTHGTEINGPNESSPVHNHSLDDVLGGLLAIPASSSTVSPAGSQVDISDTAAHRVLEYLKQVETPKGSMSSMTTNGDYSWPEQQDSPKLGRASPELSEELDQLGDQVVLVKCRNMKCGKSVELREARKSYKTCHNCYTYYCSRDCRKAHWERHKRKCLFSRVNSACKHIIKKIHDEQDILEHMTRVARTGYLSKGRGCVMLVFTSPLQAEEFQQHGLKAPHAAICFASVQELKESGALGEQVFEVIGMCKTYQPDVKFVMEICIATDAGAQVWPAPRRDSVTFKRCSKLRLSTAQVNCAHPRRDEPETLILTAVPGSEFTENMEERKAREICFVNIQQRLKQRGVILRHHFPEVYSRLCAYVADNKHFSPMTIYPVDGNTGKRFMCLIMPNSEPEVDWMYKPDLLEELGLSTAV